MPDVVSLSKRGGDAGFMLFLFGLPLTRKHLHDGMALGAQSH